MGNYRFKLSDIMPNAWFYKLRGMSHRAYKIKNAPPPQPPAAAKFLPGRASFYYSRRAEEALADRFPSEEPPRKSNKGNRKKPPAARTRLVASECASLETLRRDADFVDGESDPCCRRIASSGSDIIVDSDAGDCVQLNLRPVATKPALENDKCLFGSNKRRDQKRPSSPSPSGGLRRFRLRANSPRLAHRSVASRRQRRALPESAFAVVKASSDPQKDFRNSMMEMIVEHNIRASTDLEELLVCYLSLNSDEYHDLIVKVFKQIWFDLN
ncbi:transcription repressor OFP1-like [Zingiber officinale]|uniref:Transcription repressor n=1 Tax=Zingiber officinale TaxID=94328 RepID=A0A8J5LML1_ZINOF|nr:transcription repressor OFP1-like [Zingiber officinale]KAG6531640.1 hypothetical protein ZIOFF_005456 [Zingiber officinale]